MAVLSLEDRNWFARSQDCYPLRPGFEPPRGVLSASRGCIPARALTLRVPVALQVVLRDLVVEALTRNLEDLGHLGLVPRARLQRVLQDDALTLVIEDDGIGFDVSTKRGVGIGLASMEERARLIQADFSVESRPNGGSRVRVRVPSDPGAD